MPDPTSTMSGRQILAEAFANGVGSPVTPYRIASDKLVDLLTEDPRQPAHHGRVRAVLRRVEGQNRPAPQRDFLKWLASHERAEPASVPEPYVHPMRAPARGERRALIAEELEWVKSFRDVDPAQVSNEDAELLARLDMTAESEAGQRLVGSITDPIRRLHDRRAEEAELRATLARNDAVSAWRSPPIKNHVLPWVEEAMVAEAREKLAGQLKDGTPDELREQMLAGVEADARQEARTRLEQAWAAADTERTAVREAANARLGELARGAEPKSSKDGQRQGSAALQRAAQSRAAQPTAADLYERFGHDPSKIDAVPGTVRLDEPEPSPDRDPQPAA